MDTESLSGIPTDELRLQLEAAEAGIARLSGIQVGLIHELDTRETATAEGCVSMSQWVSGRLDVAPETAQTLVSTAQGLARLPHLCGVLAAGEVTWDRCVEVTKAATPVDEPDVLMASFDHDIAGLRRQRSMKRRMTRHDEQQLFAQRYLSLQPTLDHMAWRLTGLLPGVMGKQLQEAIDTRADEFPAFPDGVRAPLAHRRADALVALATDTPAEGQETAPPVVTVLVDAVEAAPNNAETGVTVLAGPRIGPQALEAVLCDSVIEVTARTADGEPLAIGRRSRTIPPRLRCSILARDRGCIADGCVSTYRLEVHHRVPYTDGGRTDPENLTTLCWYHHHIVIHGLGFTINPNSPPQRIRLPPPPPPHGSTPPDSAAHLLLATKRVDARRRRWPGPSERRLLAAVIERTAG